ncbi:MerC domain-containing protein [Aquimarina sp. 2201CG1-2-11]|uniref:MerC domain-containing protein n=1 Tax=Aquimarina discodermiae TaxID=3231043 RepID=UPI0034631CCE
MNISSITRKSDTLGIIASSLCFLHCLATPILFLTPTGTGILSSEHPVWWGLLDMVFLVLSFMAVRWSVKTTSKTHIKYALWISWFLLLLIIINEKLHIIFLPEKIIYGVTLFLVVLHFYNQKYCRCQNQKCCSNKTL